MTNGIFINLGDGFGSVTPRLITDESQVAYTLAAIEDLYSTAKVNQEIYLPNIPVIYKKIADGVWTVTPVAALE
jgi:hypothetical protein